MGVTYKLKEEVVEFIIEQKKENPLLSCRRLVDIIRERFQFPISKSSINTVIKNASLSNPIGRTPLGEKKTRKYKIPLEKKNLLNLEPPKPAIPELKSAPPAPGAAVLKSKIKANAATASDKVKAGAGSGDLAKPLYDGIGSVFLKAAEWEIAEKSILGKLLNDSLKQDQLTDIDTGC